jgi:hypothetical protein
LRSFLNGEQTINDRGASSKKGVAAKTVIAMFTYLPETLADHGKVTTNSFA